jgi:hypothetical protein
MTYASGAAPRARVQSSKTDFGRRGPLRAIVAAAVDKGDQPQEFKISKRVSFASPSAPTPGKRPGRRETRFKKKVFFLLSEGGVRVASPLHPTLFFFFGRYSHVVAQRTIAQRRSLEERWAAAPPRG